MAKIYTKNTWVDEVLAGNERYNTATDAGVPIESNIQINLATAVTQAGTAVDASKMNNLEDGVDAIDTLLDTVNGKVTVLTGQGADLASGSAVNIGAATGQTVTITGNTTITSFGTADAGTIRILKFSGTPLLTYNATSLKLPGSANYQVVAGDVLAFESEGSGNWKCIFYTKVSSLVALLSSPAFTDIPTAPTAAQGTNTTQIATQAAVIQEKQVFETNANDIFGCTAPGGTSLWTGTISGAPSGASVTVSAPTSGQEAVLVPTSTSQLAKLRLYNLTRGNYALISNYNTGTNVVTLTANAPANWANGDSLTIASQTVTGSGAPYIDIELTGGPTAKSGIYVTVQHTPGAAGDRVNLHPFEAYAASKGRNVWGQVATVAASLTNMPVKMSGQNCLSLFWSATAASILIREDGYLP